MRMTTRMRFIMGMQVKEIHVVGWLPEMKKEPAMPCPLKTKPDKKTWKRANRMSKGKSKSKSKDRNKNSC